MAEKKPDVKSIDKMLVEIVEMEAKNQEFMEMKAKIRAEQHKLVEKLEARRDDVRQLIQHIR